MANKEGAALSIDRPLLTTEEIDQLHRVIKEKERLLSDGFEARYKRIKVKGESMPFIQILKIKCIELAQGFAHLEMSAGEEFTNWNNMIHGGVTASLIDTAIGMALETLIDYDSEPIATIHLGIDYLAPVKVGCILCVKTTWGGLTDLASNGKAPIVRIPIGEKKLLQVSATVISKPDRIKVATGNAWFVIFGKQPRADS